MELEVFCLCLQYTDPMLYSHHKPIVIYTDYCIVHMSSLGKYCFMLFIQQIMKYSSIATFFWCKLPVSRSHIYIYFCDSWNCVNYGRKHNIRNYIGAVRLLLRRFWVWCKQPVSRSHIYIYFCDSCNCVNYGRKHIRNYIGAVRLLLRPFWDRNRKCVRQKSWCESYSKM